MPHDDATLPESDAVALVRAGFLSDADSGALLEAALRRDHPRARVLALRGLARREALTEAVLRQALGDDNVDVMREGLDLSARYLLESTVVNARIIERLAHPDALIVESAVFALGERGVSEALLEVSRITSEHDDARCREAGVVALAQLGNDAARDVIVGALNDKPTVRRRAVVALASFEGDDIEAALDRAAEDRDWQVRSAVEQLRRELD